jgi:O-succinylbenzoic acid--CoA ligase
VPESFILNDHLIELSPEGVQHALNKAETANETYCLQFMLKWLLGDQEFDQFTSGSTGPPKLIKLKRQQLIASALLAKDFFHLSSEVTLFCCLGAQYIGGKMMLVRSLVLNIPLIVKDPDSRPFKGLKHEVQFTSMVPMQMMATLMEGTHEEKLALLKCKSLLLGGASISHALMEQLQKLPIPVFQSFATSESASHIAMRRLNGPHADTYYTVLPGIKISTDERGALVMKGAVTNDEAIITNDMVELKNETQFRWIGRADFVINSGGIKIYPEALEAEISLLMEKYGNSSYLISSLSDELLGERIILCLDKLPVEASILKVELENALPRYLVPKLIVELGNLPVLKNGKPDRRSVKVQLQERFPIQ